MHKVGKRALIALCLSFCIALALTANVSAAIGGKCGDNLTWTFDNNGILTISGTGAAWSDFSFWTYFREQKIPMENMQSVVIKPGMTVIHSNLFYRCTSIKTATIPASVTKIDGNIFHKCHNLQKIIMDTTNSNFCDVDGVLFDKSKTKLICFPAGRSGTYQVPEGVKTIGMSAFVESSPDEVILPSSITTIESYGFNHTGIKKMMIPSRVTSFGDAVFYRSYDLTIYGYSGSVIEAYAKKEGIPFVSLGKDPDVTIFKDVWLNDWYGNAVIWAAEKKITTGTSTTMFSPNDTCTRAQVVTFLWRAKGQPEPKSTNNPFTDVKSSDYFYKAVLWAVENGVTEGMTKTTFGPKAGCTRGQVVTFLWRAENKPAASGKNVFTDVKADAYYYNAVLWAVGKEITNGTDATHFSPDKTCTRGQIVTFLYRDLAK